MTWQVAFTQHPMYLLIKEDTACAERTPPWGEPSIERYIERVRQNLAALRRYPAIKIGFEWSGLELELLANDAPAVFQEMCALAREGRIAFYNGTYAQPHLQTLSSESNLRQFAYGARVYRELCQWPVRVYAHQEASVHDQLPQLLRSFGLSFGMVPAFASTLGWLDEGELEIVSGRGLRFMAGHEFVSWRGLDGSEVPLYLHQRPDKRLDDFIAHETIAEKLRVPPILLEVPDLVAVDDQWLAAHAAVEIVLLDAALPPRLAECPARARARFYTNWSYIEGIRAEEISRRNWSAEAALLQAEAVTALAYALLRRAPPSFDALWRTILAAQHHDVYCFCSTELKDKASRWLQEAQVEAESITAAAAQAIVDRINLLGADGQPLVLIGSLPRPHTVRISLATDVPDPAITDDSGQSVPAEVTPSAHGQARISFLARLPGLGYATYHIGHDGDTAADMPATGPLEFQSASYQATVLPDGTFTSLVLIPSGEELLAASSVRGNQLAATDSTGLSPCHPDVVEFGRLWTAPLPGTPLDWHASAPTMVRRSPLGMTLTVHGQLNDRVKADLTIGLYHQFPRIDLTWSFAFDEASIGTFYDDSSKLRVHWPLAFAGEISHDIPFGAVAEWPGRPFFPTSWTDISDGVKGLSYFHQGTPKHYVEGRTLVNLFAWGEYTEAIGSRLWRSNWSKCFDQRLRGQHVIRCAVYPHAGDWRSAGIVAAAAEYGAAALACAAAPHPGDLPASLNLLALLDRNAAPTSVRVEGTDLACRMFAANGASSAVEVSAHGLTPHELSTLQGERVQHLSPYQIGELRLRPALAEQHVP